MANIDIVKAYQITSTLSSELTDKRNEISSSFSNKTQQINEGNQSNQKEGLSLITGFNGLVEGVGQLAKTANQMGHKPAPTPEPGAAPSFGGR